MVSWLEEHAPTRFEELAVPKSIQNQLSATCLGDNLPHLLIAGPAGVGKTAIWRLIAKEVLGQGWRGTSHVFQSRDMKRQKGAMKTFEEFLRPGGSDSKDTLAGRSSLEAFDPNMWRKEGEVAKPVSGEMKGMSRLIIIEDADSLGSLRQSYLRRMMESTGLTARFIFTTRSPSRVIDALRSRTLLFRIPSTSEDAVGRVLETIASREDVELFPGLLGDITHIAGGNLRKAIFLLELLARRNMTNDRKGLKHLSRAATSGAAKRVIEQALRGNLHTWKWEMQGGKNVRKLGGAMGEVDMLMNEHALEAEDVIRQFHDVLVGPGLFLPVDVVKSLLDGLSECDVRIKRSHLPRVQIELYLHQVAEEGRKHGLSFG